MNGPEDSNALGLSHLAPSSPIANEVAELVPHISSFMPPKASTYLPNVYSDQDLEGHHPTTLDDPPPPLGVKLTGYRLLNMSVVFAFGITKAILTYMGQSVAPTTLDWVSGAFLALW